MKQKNLAAASDDGATASTSATVPTGTGATDSVQTSSTTQQQNYAENDVGHFLGRSFSMSSAQKLEILKNCWVPPASYDFGKDAVQRKRKFKHTWLAEYTPWLAYSAKLKGALCVYCVLFPPAASSNTMGSFTLRPFVRYKDMHEFAKVHAASQCHKISTTSAKHFLQNMPVDVQLVSAHEKIIQDNKKIVASVIDTVIFCGTHDLPLRGKELHEGLFEDLIKLKIQSGDVSLKAHSESCAKNATYMSPQIQNELINIAGDVIREDIIDDLKKAQAYSILADESCDIAGKEQLSIGVRFFDEEKLLIREEFLGFVELIAMDAKTIASAIDNFISNVGLDPEKCVGQGYDGCSTMSGKDGGVQKILREKYKKALFFHCASHKLNLVVHDLNQIPAIRNTLGTIKEIIKFFRESAQRRKHVPNIPMLCETRWSQKYKCIAIFKENYIQMATALLALSKESNNATRKAAFQLYCAAINSEFIVSVCVISKYSALLQPIVNVLQSKSIDLLQCANHIKRIIDILRKHRGNVDEHSCSFVAEAQEIADALEVDFTMPRIAKRQTHRENPPAESPTQFWKRSLIIPYIDSLIMSLEERFSENNLPAYSLISLHPYNMLQMTFEEFFNKTEAFCEFYNLNSTFHNEAELWYHLWEEKKETLNVLKDMEVADLIKDTEMFYPSVKTALAILLAQPCTTCTIERSFSTLRRVKTWLRSTMGENRLSGLCMLSVHRKRIAEAKNKLEAEMLKRFCQNPRRLLLK